MQQKVEIFAMPENNPSSMLPKIQTEKTETVSILQEQHIEEKLLQNEPQDQQQKPVNNIGWLVVNPFISGTELNYIYKLFLHAAQRRGIQLVYKYASDIMYTLDELCQQELPAFCIFWDKDIILARRLEECGVTIYNSADAISLCASKLKTYLALNTAGIPYPKTFYAPMTFPDIGYTSNDFLDAPEDKFGYPYVIKEEYSRGGEECYLIYSREEAEYIVEDMGSKRFVMQEYLSYKPGYIIKANVVDNECLCALKQVNQTNWRSNLRGNHTIKAIDTTDEIEQLAIAASNACECSYAGVDLIYDNDGQLVVCEVNANPHFRKSMTISKVNLADEIMDMIKKENNL